MLSDNDLWKNDEIMAVNAEVGLTFDVLAKLCRAIEAAVLEAQGKQEPVAWLMELRGRIRFTEDPDARKELESYGWDTTSLYAAPVVQGMVMVPQEVIEKIEQWSRAYPTDIFPEPDFEKVREALEGSGITLDSVSASNMRHVITGVWKMIAAAEGKG